MLEETIPVVGFLDLTGVSEESICDVKYKVKNVLIKPNNPEEHSILVDIEVEIVCDCYEEKEISIIQDMYSPSVNIEFTENKVNTMFDLKNTTDTINMRDKIKLGDMEHTKICNVEITPVINDMNVSKDKIKVDGDVDLNFILSNDKQDSVTTLNKQIPFDFTQEIEGLTEDSKVDMEIIPTFREFTEDGMDVKASVDLCVNTNSYNLERLNVIDRITESEEECTNPYSMIIYFTKTGDTLWKIAKKYKSTVDDIARVNDIENPNKITPGMQLFIPKCSICRASA